MLRMINVSKVLTTHFCCKALQSKTLIRLRSELLGLKFFLLPWTLTWENRWHVNSVVDFLIALIELFSLGVTAVSLRAKTWKIGDFAPTRSVWSKISGRRGCPHQSFCMNSYAMNALQLCRWQFSHKKNFVADFLQAKCDFRRKSAVLRFWTPLGACRPRTMIILGSMESA